MGLLLVVSHLGYSQQVVTLTSADMPTAGQNYIYVQAPPTFQFDASATGNNYNWDYSTLQGNTQSTDSFMAVLQTPLVYNIVFNLPFDPQKATVANNLAPIPSLGSIPLPFPISFSNENSFYRTESSLFEQVGFALMANYNGTTVPLPVKYDEPDVIYNLPLQFGQNQPASQSRYEFQIPGLMTYIENKTRTNTVDGQGTLQIPNGIFDVLRVKSELDIVDSIYLDTLGFWFPAPARQEVEYKWVSAAHGWPVLEIKGRQSGFPFNQFQVTEVKYLKLEPIANTVNEQLLPLCKIYPVPAFDNVIIEGATIKEVWLTGIDGKIINHQNTQDNAIYTTFSVDLGNIAPGLYFVTVKHKNNHYQTYKLPVK